MVSHHDQFPDHHHMTSEYVHGHEYDTYHYEDRKHEPKHFTVTRPEPHDIIEKGSYFHAHPDQVSPSYDHHAAVHHTYYDVEAYPGHVVHHAEAHPVHATHLDAYPTHAVHHVEAYPTHATHHYATGYPHLYNNEEQESNYEYVSGESPHNPDDYGYDQGYKPAFDDLGYYEPR
jgi:hypothetical protein